MKILFSIRFSFRRIEERLEVLGNQLFLRICPLIDEFISRIVGMEKLNMQVQVLHDKDRSENHGRNGLVSK
jgi:hypothetical protein